MNEPKRTAAVVNFNELERHVNNAFEAQRIGQKTAGEISHEDLGRLSAEAVLSQYEGAAKAIEGLGEEITDRARKLEASLIEADRDLKLIAEAAEAIREKGKLVYVQIEEASGVSRNIRDVCAELRNKVGI